MNKKILFFAVFCSATAANAGFLRVSNVDASAPYSTIDAAVNAATEGDTIMVDGTSVDYDATTIDKRLVVIGPGYWLRENGISTEMANAASIQEITTTKEGTVLMGLNVYNNVNVEGAKTVITRCHIGGNISIKGGTNNCIIRQNFLTGDVGSGYDHSFFHQITNNIFGNVSCKGIGESYIAYNTSFNHWGESFWNSANCTIEKNIFYTEDLNKGDGNTIRNNYYVGELYQDITTDKDVSAVELPAAAAGYGVFAGDEPYVISGIPAGPMIEELVVPASVEEGSVMEVTIKLGKAK